jgi:hypothetical protein
MSKQNFKSQAKRKRELAKLDKRQAKDQKRAARRGDPADPAVAVAVAPALAVAVPLGTRAAAPVAPKPLTLAEAVERWKNTKIAKPKYR